VTSVASFRNGDFIYKGNEYQDHGIYRTVDNEFLLCVLHKQHVQSESEGRSAIQRKPERGKERD